VQTCALPISEAPAPPRARPVRTALPVRQAGPPEPPARPPLPEPGRPAPRTTPMTASPDRPSAPAPPSPDRLQEGPPDEHATRRRWPHPPRGQRGRPLPGSRPPPLALLLGRTRRV